MEAIAAH